MEAPPEAGHRRRGLRHHGEHRRRQAGRHQGVRAADRSGQGQTILQFAYDPEQDLYRCTAGEVLLPRTKNKARRLTVYKAKAATCEACELKSKCTDNKTGRQVPRYLEESYVDRVRSYRGNFPYEKALRKRRVWVEPLFAEAKDRHGMRRFGLRRLEKVNAEALLVATGQNVKRLLAFGHRRPGSMPRRRPYSHRGTVVLRCSRDEGLSAVEAFRSSVLQQPGKLSRGH